MMKLLAFLFTFALAIPTHAQDSGQGNAGSSAAQSVLTAGMNVATGAMLYTACKATTPPSIPLCVMGGLSVAQAGLDLLTSKSSKSAAQAFSNAPSGSADWENLDLGNGMTGGQLDDKLAFVDSKNNALKKDLAKLGVDVDKGTVSTPKGTKALSSLGSGKAMADAGLISVDQIDEIDAAIKKNQSKYANIAMNNSIGGGGGGSGGSRSPARFDLPATDYSSLFGEKEKPNAPKTAGLVKTIDGQPYGASVNNIFDMIRNRYEIKTREKTFVEN
mgnify:CR=1 FL=1